MHKKILVADGQRAIIGGSNYGYRYEGPQQWRDTNVLLTGPIVTTLQQEYNYDWDNRSAAAHLVMSAPALAPPAGPLTLREIDQKPSEDDYDINHAILIGLRIARQRVDIEAPYFNPSDWLLAELTDAVDRGVQVRILMNSQMSNDVPQAYYVDASWFGTVLERGIRIFLWDRTVRTMHSKAMVVDDSLAMAGTYNFNARSILWDTENAIFTTDPGAIRLIDEMIQKDFQQQDLVQEIDLEWVSSQPLCEQLKWGVFGLVGLLF
jgi:cardiolipin synthase